MLNHQDIHRELVTTGYVTTIFEKIRSISDTTVPGGWHVQIRNHVKKCNHKNAKRNEQALLVISETIDTIVSKFLTNLLVGIEKSDTRYNEPFVDIARLNCAMYAFTRELGNSFSNILETTECSYNNLSREGYTEFLFHMAVLEYVREESKKPHLSEKDIITLLILGSEKHISLYDFKIRARLADNKYFVERLLHRARRSATSARNLHVFIKPYHVNQLVFVDTLNKKLLKNESIQADLENSDFLGFRISNALHLSLVQNKHVGIGYGHTVTAHGFFVMLIDKESVCHIHGQFSSLEEACGYRLCLLEQTDFSYKYVGIFDHIWPFPKLLSYGDLHIHFLSNGNENTVLKELFEINT